MLLSGLSVTWLGHGTFLLVSPEGRRILIDPWLDGNPSCPPAFRTIDKVDLILVTHGHFDHVHDAATVAKATGATVVGIFELCDWLASKGVTTASGMNKGGTQEQCGVRITMVDARHSSSCVDDGVVTYLGEAAGYVLRFSNGLTVYFAGDTAVFGDMRLIRELYSPSIAFLPIGDFFTMDPSAAAKAVELLGVRKVIPMHYGTFPILTGRPEQLRELVAPLGVEVVEMQPGQTLA
ncbi:MAG: metal-dependent hydrolase [Acidobacteria bacterium]|nr:metal-dependent hydrolase [Acidobacteriota bacterium]